MGESDTDSTGWSVESSEGTPTQAEQEHPIPNTSDDISPAAAEKSEPVGEMSPPRARDDGGRFAKESEPTEDVVEKSAPPAEKSAPPAKRSHEGRKLTLQQEIDALTRQKHEAARELEQARREREQYRPPPPPPQPQGETFPAFDAWSTAFPNATYEDYIDARADYRAESRIQAFQQETAAQQRAREAEHKTLTLRDKGKSVYNDWDDVFTGLQLEVPQPVWHTILTDPDGHRLAYELATHPETVYQMAGMDPLQIGVALGTLKARWAGAPAAPPAPSRPASAPPPITPLGSSPTQPVSSPDDLDFGPEYVRRMNEAERKRRRL